MRALFCATFVLLVGCNDGDDATTDDATSATDTDAPTAFQAQVDRGATVYGEHCAGCHGDNGEGTDLGPRVVGLAEGALPLDPPLDAARDVTFTTAGDIAGWVAANMPGDAPGSLDLDEYVDVLAFALFANGVDREDEVTLDNAADLTIPR